MPSQTEDPILEQAVFGRQVEDFVDSPIGKYLTDLCRSEKEYAIRQLLKVSPWRRRRITELQNEIWRCNRFNEWLSEAVINGRQALRIMENKDD